MNCEQELCRNWSGDGVACPCAVFGLKPDVVDELIPVCLVPVDESEDEW